MKAYSQDLRDRVLAAGDGGMPTQQVAATFGVSPAWVRRLKQRRRETGETSPRPWGGCRFVRIDPVRLRQLWQERPDRTLEEYRQTLAAEGVIVSGQSISDRLIKMGLRYKKNTDRHRAGTPGRGPAAALVATMAADRRRRPHRHD